MVLGFAAGRGGRQAGHVDVVLDRERDAVERQRARPRVRFQREGARQGLFRVRPLIETRAFPEVGLYRPEVELTEYGSNPELLKQVSEFTGGRFEPQPKAIFDAGERSLASTLQLWPGLLVLAILANIVELVMRKWKGLFGKT